MRVAAIDIGTNTILMLVADVDQDGAIAPLHDEHAIARMGKGVDEHGIISRETIERVSDFLHRYKAIADSFNPTVISACGTSALRDAANAGELIDSVEQRTGIKIEVLNGHEEAELTYLGAISEFLKDGASRPYTVLDIGGGSTELTVGQGTTLTRSESVNLGAVRLTERILKTSPPARNTRVAAYEEVKSWISKLSPPPPSVRFHRSGRNSDHAGCDRAEPAIVRPETSERTFPRPGDC